MRATVYGRFDVINEPLTEFDITQPITYSHLYDETEAAMAAVLRQLLKDGVLTDINDIFQYGTPFLGSKTVVERFTKLNGLAVLRRNDNGLSDKIMAIILANWQALASERGLAFLQFVLDMLYPGQNQIIRLWHSKSKAQQYPNYLYESEADNRFLTSRIRIKLEENIDVSELVELAPVFRRLVPWQIVPEIAINFEMADNKLGMAVAGEIFHVADYSPF